MINHERKLLGPTYANNVVRLSALSTLFVSSFRRIMNTEVVGTVRTRSQILFYHVNSTDKIQGRGACAGDYNVCSSDISRSCSSRSYKGYPRSCPVSENYSHDPGISNTIRRSSTLLKKLNALSVSPASTASQNRSL